jgi:hypothetical protein
MDAVRATAEALQATHEQMRELEDMRRLLRQVADITPFRSN